MTALFVIDDLLKWLTSVWNGYWVQQQVICHLIYQCIVMWRWWKDRVVVSIGIVCHKSNFTTVLNAK